MAAVFCHYPCLQQGKQQGKEGAVIPAARRAEGNVQPLKKAVKEGIDGVFIAQINQRGQSKIDRKQQRCPFQPLPFDMVLYFPGSIQESRYGIFFDKYQRLFPVIQGIDGQGDFFTNATMDFSQVADNGFVIGHWIFKDIKAPALGGGLGSVRNYFL